MADTGYSRYVTAAKSDTVDFGGGDSTKTADPYWICDAIFVGTGGVVNVVDQAGNLQVFTVATGGQIGVRARRVQSASTTAALMVAMFR